MAGHGFHAVPLSIVKGDPSPGPTLMLPPFQTIYRQYFDFVWASARRLGVPSEAMDDVVQEIFVVIHTKMHSIEKPDALRSWIYGVVRRTVSGHRRSRRAEVSNGRSLDAGTDAESPEPTPFEHTERNADLELLSTLLNELDEPKREVFALVEVDELTVPEAAEALQIPLNTAYSRLRAARQAFEAALGRHEARNKGK
ncbi:MAG TPA: sigma-70 family RNA polymerase sigma factor [Polyangiaceae bacterium]|jgi:RNA polymerase sigma-70 factor (ECF subfamily)